MTEIPEHLLKRAQAAREKAAADSEAATNTGASAAASGSEAAADPRIPAHLLELSRAAKWPAWWLPLPQPVVAFPWVPARVATPSASSPW